MTSTVASLLDLVAPDRRDAREVVVVLPALAADGDEVAARAVLARPRVRLGPLLDVRAQPPLRGAQDRRRRRPAGRSRPRSCRARRAAARAAAPGSRAISLRVPGELEHRRRLRAARELRVVRLVAPRAEVGRLVDADDEVGAPAPAVARERRLVDDVARRRASPPRWLRRPRRSRAGPRRARSRRRRGPSARSAARYARLVQVALLCDELGERLAAVRPRVASSRAPSSSSVSGAGRRGTPTDRRARARGRRREAAHLEYQHAAGPLLTPRTGG